MHLYTRTILTISVILIVLVFIILYYNVPLFTSMDDLVIYYRTHIPQYLRDRIQDGAVFGLMVAVYGRYQSYRESKKLAKRRKFTFASLLHKAQYIDERIEKAKLSIGKVLGLPEDIVNDLIAEAMVSPRIWDEEGNIIESEYLSLLSKCYKRKESVLIESISEFKACVNNLKNDIAVIDDTIEVHISLLDFESAYYTNNFRTSLRDLGVKIDRTLQRVSDHRDEINSSLSNRLIKEWDEVRSKLTDDKHNQITEDVVENKLKAKAELDYKTYVDYFNESLIDIQTSALPLRNYILDGYLPRVKSIGKKFDKGGLKIVCLLNKKGDFIPPFSVDRLWNNERKLND